MEEFSRINEGEPSVLNRIIDIIIPAGFNIFDPSSRKAIEKETRKKICDQIVDDDKISYHDKQYIISNLKKLEREYANQCGVFEKAMQILSSSTNICNVNDDWLYFFFDKVRLISDDQVQNLWARLLASELTESGSVSKLLINSLSLMETIDAVNFLKLSSFVFKNRITNDLYPLIYISNNLSAYSGVGVSTKMLSRLETLGLVSCDWENDFVVRGIQLSLEYMKNKIDILVPEENVNRTSSVAIGNVRFTREGEKLAQIISRESNIDSLKFCVRKQLISNYNIFINGKAIYFDEASQSVANFDNALSIG